MVKRRAAALAAALALAAASCQVLLGLDSDPNVIENADAVAPGGEGGPDAKNEADVVGDASLDGDGNPCSVTNGGRQVPIGDPSDPSFYCIDRFEVTVGDYRTFMVEGVGNLSTQRAECVAANASFIPVGGIPDPSFDDYPVRNVTFCDAVAFCDFVGKRLCGAIDGGQVPLDAELDPNVDEWYRACSHDHDGAHQYAPGNNYDFDASQKQCNFYASGSAAPVGSYPECEGGYPGIYDMTGNVAEFEDSCFVDAGTILCRTRGGSYSNGYMAAGECSDLNNKQQLDGGAPGVGFRCCSR